MGSPPRIPVWLPWEQRVIYFVTICVENRQCVLANHPAFAAFKTAIDRLRHWRSACGDPDARPHARFRRANARSRREAGEFFSRSETVDAPGTKRIVEFSTRLFRSSSALDESLHDKWLYVWKIPSGPGCRTLERLAIPNRTRQRLIVGRPLGSSWQAVRLPYNSISPPPGGAPALSVNDLMADIVGPGFVARSRYPASRRSNAPGCRH